MGDDRNCERRRDAATLIAHRGFAGLYPENTLAAIRGASSGRPDPAADRPRADLIEIDVMPSGEGVPVVFHDATLGNLTDASGSLADRFVWETPTDRLRELRVLDSPETIPTLREAMATVPPDVGVNVELKNPGTEDLRVGEKLSDPELRARTEVWSEFVGQVLRVVSEFDNDILVSSFCESALAAVRDADDSIPLGCLFWDSIRDGLAIADHHDCEALHPPRNMIRGTPFFGAEYLAGQTPETFADVDLVAKAHEAGRRVNVWTVTSWHQADRLRAAGVDGLIADYDAVRRYGAGGA